MGSIIEKRPAFIKIDFIATTQKIVGGFAAGEAGADDTDALHGCLSVFFLLDPLVVMTLWEVRAAEKISPLAMLDDEVSIFA